MRSLLPSGGITNATIKEALVGMPDKPITECNALFTPTAQYGHRRDAPGLGTFPRVTGHST